MESLRPFTTNLLIASLRIHKDIKPESIISVQNQLKLADLGFSKVIHKFLNRESFAKIAGLTQPYGTQLTIPVTLTESEH
jgi:serine/threonine protein kinase